MKEWARSWTFLAISFSFSITSAQNPGGGPPAPSDPVKAKQEARGTGEPSPAKPGTVPLELDREHRFIWVLDRRKVGETVVNITRVDADRGSPWTKIYHSSSRYRYEREGISQRGEYDSYFDPSWKPLRYEWHHHWSGVREYRSRQDHEGSIRGGRLSYSVIHNHDTQNPVTGEIEAPPDGYLYLSQAIDTWAILAGDLLREPRNYVAKVMYPDYLKLTEVTFAFEKDETLEPAGPCRAYSFKTREGDHAGKVWIDRRGRMVQYLQGTLKIYLELVEAGKAGEVKSQKSKVER